MNTSISVLPALLVSFLLFSGCIGAESADGGASAAADQPDVASGPAQFDDTTGGIEGVVTDEELAPIPGALVGVIQDETVTADIVATTDETGRFSLSHVPPGDHSIAASALGYGSSTKRVAVEAGTVVETSLALEQLAVAMPYSTTLIHRGAQTGAMVRATPQCLYLSQSVPEQVPNRNLLKTCNGARVCDAGATCELSAVDELLKETDPKSIVLEMDWQAQSGATGRAYWLDLSGPNVSRQAGGSIDQADKRYWMVHQGEGPIQIRIDVPESLIERQVDEADWYSYPDGKGCAQSSCAWLYRAWPSYCDLSSATGTTCGSSPVDYGVQQGAVFTVYLTIFYLEPAPVGFTGVPDA
jgi:hypothetical protein